MHDARAKGILLVLIAAILEYGQGPHVHAQEVHLASRSDVVHWLRHQEALVRSADCDMEVMTSGARPEMIPLIEEVCRITGKRNNYKTSEEFERVQSYTMRWWRSGAKERYKKTQLVGEAEEAAFDGQIVRQYDGKGHGAVLTMESAHWADTDRVHPYQLLYLHYGRPFSDVFEQGLNFRLTREQRQGQALTRVQISDPKESTHSIILFFSSDGRMVERHLIRQLGGDPKPFIRQIHILSDYQAHPSASGEKIWFPSKAVYHYFMGVHPTAGLAEWMTRSIRIKNIKFNVDIPDDFFDLRIPRSAEVWDGVTGLGVLKPGERPEHLFPEEARRKRWITVAVVVAVAVTLTIIAVWYRRRRRRLGES